MTVEVVHVNAGWTTAVVIAAVLVLLAVVALDRNRLRRRLDAMDGAVAGLRLDLQAAHDRIAQLEGDLDRPPNPDDVADRQRSRPT